MTAHVEDNAGLACGEVDRTLQLQLCDTDPPTRAHQSAWLWPITVDRALAVIEEHARQSSERRAHLVERHLIGVDRWRSTPKVSALLPAVVRDRSEHAAARLVGQLL